jgi:4-hydroxybenzoate polyprenyltransferase
MVYQTSQLLLLNSPDSKLLFFVFFATICSYSFHWYLTADSVIPSPRIKWTQQHRTVLLLLFLVGLTGASIYFFLLLQFWFWLLLASVITFLYSAPKIPHPWFRALRKVALGKTIFLALVWMYVTTVLPMVLSKQPWRADFTWFVISRFFLVYAICILFDYRDREDDKAAGIRSLITYLSVKGINRLFVVSLLIFTVATLALLNFNQSTLTIAILLLPGIITGGLYNYARQNFHDLLYYFVLDGLMALSGVMMIITGLLFG